MASPWQINLGQTYFDPEQSNWVQETKIADWAKPYVTADGGYKNYQQLKGEGLWDLSNPNLQRYFDALSNEGGQTMQKFGATGDWRTSPSARNTLFARLGVLTSNASAPRGLPGFVTPQEAFGDFFDPASYDAVERARAQQVYEKNKGDSGGLGGLVDTAGDFAEGFGKNFVLPALATYFGVNALGGALGGAGAAGAGEAAGAAELGASAGGTGAGTTGLAASGSPLMPAAIPPTDPTFGGVLTQTGAGVYENVGNIGAFGALGGGGVPGGSLAPVDNGGILNTGITTADLLRGLPGVVGAIASDRQADDYNRLANAYTQMGAPSRARFEASFAPDFSMENDPGYLDALRQAARANAHALSVSSGNPYGNPNALIQSQADLYSRFAYPALQEFRRLNSASGGLSQFAGAAPSAAGAGIQAQGNVFNSLGGAAADIFNPPTPLEEVIRRMSRTSHGMGGAY